MMQHVMPPPIGKAFQRWADKVSAAVLRGQELYFLGLPKEMEDLEVDPNAAHGFLLECFGEDGYLVAEHDLEGMTVERVQEILDDDDADRVMVLSHPVSGDMLAAVVADRDIAVDEGRYEYFVSGWADRGYRTPRGYYPPPRSLPAYPDAEKVRPPKTSG